MSAAASSRAKKHRQRQHQKERKEEEQASWCDLKRGKPCCQAKTADGSQCKRTATGGFKICNEYSCSVFGFKLLNIPACCQFCTQHAKMYAAKVKQYGTEAAVLWLIEGIKASAPGLGTTMKLSEYSSYNPSSASNYQYDPNVPYSSSAALMPIAIPVKEEKNTLSTTIKMAAKMMAPGKY